MGLQDLLPPDDQSEAVKPDRTHGQPSSTTEAEEKPDHLEATGKEFD